MWPLKPRLSRKSKGLRSQSQAHTGSVPRSLLGRAFSHSHVLPGRTEATVVTIVGIQGDMHPISAWNKTDSAKM